jgi:lactoylglutathione lyase
MRYLHAMVRVTDLNPSLHFFREALGLVEVRRSEHEAGRFTLVYLAATGDAPGAYQPQVELTYNWPSPSGEVQTYSGGRNFGHLAFAVPDVYAACERLQRHGVTVLRPPRDGRMAFVRSPDGISIELLQDGPALAPAEPWASMPNTGSW